MSETVVFGQKLAAKIMAVQKGAANIPKNGYNDFHKYHYVLAADAVEAIRELCVANQLVVTTLGVNGVSRFLENAGNKGDQTVTEVHITYLVVDPESGESVTFDWVGHGADPLDKGIFKAFTGAQKYGLMQFFMVGGDDADPETVTARDRKNEKRNTQQQSGEPTVKTMKSKHDNGFCWFCKKKHIPAGSEIVGLEGIEGESKAVWGCKAGYETWKQSQGTPPEATEGTNEAEPAPTAENTAPIPGHEQKAKGGPLTLARVRAMNPGDKMTHLMTKPGPDLIILANKELATTFENNITTGGQFLDAMLEKKIISDLSVEKNTKPELCHLICEIWAVRAKKYAGK